MLSDFVTQNTRKFFVAMAINQDFLLQDLWIWNSNEEYNESCRTVLKIKVVNDAAKRGVALIQNFNSVITNREEHKLYQLQVVEIHRQQLSHPTKSVIVRELCMQ